MQESEARPGTGARHSASTSPEPKDLYPLFPFSACAVHRSPFTVHRSPYTVREAQSPRAQRGSGLRSTKRCHLVGLLTPVTSG